MGIGGKKSQKREAGKREGACKERPLPGKERTTGNKGDVIYGMTSRIQHPESIPYQAAGQIQDRLLNLNSVREAGLSNLFRSFAIVMLEAYSSA
jgi:hypothetical protein